MTEPRTASDDAVLSEVADAVPHIIWTNDAAGTATYFNRRWTEYTGLSLEETLRVSGQTIIHPDDRARVVQMLTEARRDGTSSRSTYRLRDVSGVYRLHEARVVPVRRDASGKVTLWVGTATDVDERERRNEEQRYLAQATSILGTSLEVQRTLADVARMLVPKLADWCAVDLLRDDGTLDRAVVEHIDPTKVELAWKLWKLVPPNPDAPQGAFAVMRSRKPELVHVTDEMLVAGISDPEILALYRGLGLCSAINVPLLARGRVLGLLSLVTAESQRLYNEHDVGFAEEVAHRISLAIDNARLYEAATQARVAAEAIAAEVAEQSHAVERELLTMRAERDAARAELEALRAGAAVTPSSAAPGPKAS